MTRYFSPSRVFCIEICAEYYKQYQACKRQPWILPADSIVVLLHHTNQIINQYPYTRQMVLKCCHVQLRWWRPRARIRFVAIEAISVFFKAHVYFDPSTYRACRSKVACKHIAQSGDQSTTEITQTYLDEMNPLSYWSQQMG